MLQNEFHKHVDESLCQIQDLLNKKNADYGGDTGDVLNNIKTCEILGICSAEQGILIRIADKYKRMITLLASKKDPEVTDETIDDTIRDIIGYLILILAVRKDRNATDGQRGSQSPQ